MSSSSMSVCRRVSVRGSMVLLLAISACSDSTGPAERPLFDAVASVRWNAIARDLVAKYRTDPPMASRIYALLSVAQDRAVGEAVSRQGSSQPLDHAAAIGASGIVLKAMFPQEAAFIDSIARRDLANPSFSGDARFSLSEGESLGIMIAQQLLASRTGDGSAGVFTGTMPTGPGMWFSSANPPAPPVRPLWGSVQPWLMSNGAQFRPEAPPAFGSPAFQTALVEVRQFSNNRSARELNIATFWADGAGTSTPPGHWNQIAADLVTWYNLSERDAAHLLAVLNMAVMDAGIAVWDAKFVYWLIRPSQVDPAITTPVGLPNFPSYVSGHSGFSGAASEVLAHFFPREASSLRQQADDAAISRLFGGIHYRFDNEVGLRMGRAIAQLAVQQERTAEGRIFERRRTTPGLPGLHGR